ncbi:MAG: hypothetical protein PF795_09695 [Kiritimatiellae bacterium]|jgi:hypothetical protein|nr:hypothetical protein [Kiritimatiellia bacterium]
MSALSKFYEELNRFPDPGGGVHGHVMRLARLATFAKIPTPEAMAQIKAAMPRAPSSGNEVEESFVTASNTATGGDYDPSITKAERETAKRQKEAQKKIKKAAAVEAVKSLAGEPVLPFTALRKASPFDVGDFRDQVQQCHNAGIMLETLHGPEAVVYCGGTYGGRECMASVQTWQERFTEYSPPPFHIVNTFTGEPGETKGGDGKLSYRADSCIAAHRYALYECDLPEVPIEWQAAFLLSRMASGWPIVSVVWSGGKSLHALYKVDCANVTEWDQVVRGELFPRWESMGADKACANPSRLSRIPGHFRTDKEYLQALMYLNPAHGYRAPKTSSLP